MEAISRSELITITEHSFIVMDVSGITATCFNVQGYFKFPINSTPG
ncbi:hypothetical protein ACT54K_18520 [Leptospira interrogans]|nr:hypothetical protein [Leptospira interrogans]